MVRHTMRLLAVFAGLLLLGAISPHLLVEVSFPEAAIGAYEVIERDAVNSASGDWRLVLLDPDGARVAETWFSPDIDVPWGGTEQAETLWVPIKTRNDARALAVIGPDGRERDRKSISNVCGDGRCDRGEENLCTSDCPLLFETEEALAQAADGYQEAASSSWRLWVIVACAILILTLIATLLHLNRSKPY